MMEFANDRAVKVLVTYSHRLVREALTRQLALENSVDVIAAAADVSAARGIMTVERPDLILVEADVSNTELAEWIDELVSLEKRPKLIVIADEHDEDAALAFIGAGVEGYLLKDSSYSDLLSAIERVMKGDYIFDQALAVPVIKRVAARLMTSHSAAEKPVFSGLSNREKEIAALASQGLTNDEISEAMFITPNTVKTHLRRVYQRLGISSRRQLMQQYMNAS